MPQDIGLWIKPILYLLVVVVMAWRANHAASAFAAVLPPEERKGAMRYDREADLLLRDKPWRLFTGTFLTRMYEVGTRRQDDPTVERKRQEAIRWLGATILVLVLGLPLL
jgi:hypothetical protein